MRDFAMYTAPLRDAENGGDFCRRATLDNGLFGGFHGLQLKFRAKQFKGTLRQDAALSCIFGARRVVDGLLRKLRQEVLIIATALRHWLALALFVILQNLVPSDLTQPSSEAAASIAIAKTATFAGDRQKDFLNNVLFVLSNHRTLATPEQKQRPVKSH